MTLKLSTLAIALGLGYSAPQIFALAQPGNYAAAARKFSRNVPVGYVLMVLATVWFLYNVGQESVADFAAYKHYMLMAFAAIGLGSCVFVKDFLAVRGMAVVMLLLAKLMVDTGRPHLGDSPWVLVNQSAAYVLVVAGIWLTISPWRFRDWMEWNTANPARLKFGAGLRLLIGLVFVVLGAAVFRAF